MYLKKKIESIRFAINGLQIAWREEPNFRLHTAITPLVILASYFLQVPVLEFLIILSVIGIVIVAELFNTALEELCDKFQPTHDPHIAKIKDLSASAVFLASIIAAIVGLIIFIPRAIILFTT